MQAVRIGLIVLLLALVLCLLIWIGLTPLDPQRESASAGVGKADQSATLRIGIMPLRDVFEQRRRYRLLAEYLSEQLHQPVEVVTLGPYQDILDDFAARQVDAAFVASLVAVLAIDRYQARVLVRPQLSDGASSYRGVMFVLEDSPIRSIDDLRHRRVAMVRTTTGGSLFPLCEMKRHRLLDEASRPTPLWVATHDDAILAVLERRADAGAVKDHWLDTYERSNRGRRFRRLSESELVPDNALVVRAGLPERVAQQLSESLLHMHEVPRGRETLNTINLIRFVECAADDYAAVYEMVEFLKDDWGLLEIAGGPPILR